MIPPLQTWLTEPLSSEVLHALHRLQQSDDVQAIAVMPDVHLAEEICIGTVVATENLLYPNAVGGDIGCGMATVRLQADAMLLDNEHHAAQLLSGLYQRIPTLKHSKQSKPSCLPSDLEERSLSTPSLERMKLREGLLQLGTLGQSFLS